MSDTDNPARNADQEAWTKRHLGRLLWKKGDYVEAERVLRNSIEIRRKNPNPDRYWNLDGLACSLRDLGSLLVETGRIEEGEKVLREALSIDDENLGPKQRKTLMTRAALAAAWTELGRLDEAESVLRATLEDRRAQFVGSDPDIADNLRDLGVLLRKKGEWNESEALLREAIRGHRLGSIESTHPHLASCYHELGVTLCEKGEYEEAIPMFEQSIALEKNRVGENHQAFATSLDYMGYAYSRLDHAAKGEPLMEKAEQILRNIPLANQALLRTCLEHQSLVSGLTTP